MTVLMTSTSKYAQLTLNTSHKPVHVLLRSMDKEALSWFQDPQVAQAIALACLNDAYGCMSPHVSPQWKGRAIALELSRIALLRLTDRTIVKVDSAAATRLLEAGHYLSDMFVGISTQPFIVDGVMTTEL